jgi:superfamily I DNA/RNA helicase
MAFLPSKYQRTVYTYIRIGKGNAVIDAVAGSGKSTTIVEALKQIPKGKRVLFLAFNKAIVEELKIKIGNMPNVDIKTLHSLGASLCMRNLDCQIQDDKYRVWVNNGVNYSNLVPSVPLPDEQMGAWKQNILKLIDLGRCNLVKTVAELEDLSYKHDIDLLDNEADLALKGIQWGERETAFIDFTDMIYFPNVKQLKIFKYDWVFIDECQDLNAAQRELFLKCVKPNGGRFIAVGDPRQAIYGFAGADVESFNLLKKIPGTVKLPLSVCYRCDKDIIDLAKSIVPQIEARDNAPSGMVNRNATLSEIQDGDMVLCRLTAPLVDLCMKYISSGVKAYVKGRDIGTNLVNMIKKTNRKQIKDVEERLQRELSRIIGKVVSKQKCTEKEARESDVYKRYEDKVKAIEVLSEGLQTAKEVIDRIETIFSDGNKSGICLSTIHKSKGLESDRVFIICEDKLWFKPCMNVPWMAEQESNLVYVAYTRAKHYLGFVKDFVA